MGDHISNFYATVTWEEKSGSIRNPFIYDEAEESEVVSMEQAEEVEQLSRKRRWHEILLISDDDSRKRFSWTFLTIYFIKFSSIIHDIVNIHIYFVS